MECPENRCPVCWYNGVDTLVGEGSYYCQEHEELLR